MSSVWTRLRREARLWPEERAHKKIDETLKKLRTYWRLVLTQIILIVASIVLSMVIFGKVSGGDPSEGVSFSSLFAIPLVLGFAIMVFGIIMLVVEIYLLSIIVNLSDVIAFLYRYDCGYIEDFSVDIRSLRNMSVTCILCQFLFPFIMPILLFIFWRKYRRFNEYWTGDHGKVV